MTKHSPFLVQKLEFPDDIRPYMGVSERKQALTIRVRLRLERSSTKTLNMRVEARGP